MLPIQTPYASAANIFCTESISESSLHKQYISEWTEWAEITVPGENKEVALSQLKLCLENNECSLDLSWLGLTSLPTLPHHVISLNIDNNALTSLPLLPHSLERLEVNANKLTMLPELPGTLKVLCVNNNHLSTLPELPSSLEEIYVNRNQIVTLPELPLSLKKLDITDNYLSVLPELPASLETINSSHNQLTELPRLPESLECLNVCNNRLLTIPELPALLVTLDTSYNKLTKLPELPASLKNLSAIHNHLTGLPRLSESLKSLDVAHNELTTIPELPVSLETLRSSYNQLAVLPGLPELLKSLDVDHNRLSALPKLPASLEKIDTCQNHLTELPELPISLRSFNVSFNLLARLPGLPESLEHINVHHNHLTTLPELPASLKKIDASVNHLERLPDFSAENNQGRRIFWFRHNQITHIPESITGLNEISLVDLESNPLSGRTLQSLQQLMSSPDYHGPQIHFSMSDGQQYTPVRSLTEAVAAWFPESLRSEVSQRWGAFTDEENASTFSAFLDRLADTVTARNAPGFGQQVSEFLENLSRSEALRQQCFAVAADATRSCEDRVALTWNNLQKTYRVHQASEGEFDSDLTGLLSLGREMYRLEVLEELAREKVRTLHFVDEIEVYLAFQTMLAEKLELSTAVREMRFYGVSGVTEDDLSSASARVLSREEREFEEWFARWSPWHAVLKRTEAERWARAEEKKYEMLEREYPQRLAERLSALGLSGDGDAEREAGVRVMEEIETEIYRQLTEEVSGERLAENRAR